MPAEEKTEQATPRKRQEARRKGQVARSPEVTSASLFLAFVLTLPVVFGWMAERLILIMQSGVYSAGTMRFSQGILWNALLLLVPVMGIAVIVAITVNLLQVGITFSAHPLKPDLSRIDPIRGFQRLFSSRALFEFVKSLLKLAIIGWVAWRTIQGEMDSILETGRMPIDQSVTLIGGVLHQLGVRIGFLWLIIACADYFYQRWQFEKSIRMSRHEIKEEFRQAEGDPTVRARIRQKMAQMAQRRMMNDVRKADVVVTNPVTYAVALRYDRVTMRAPRVVAKGKGWLAQRIREEALKWHVPISPNPPLARSLYSQVEIGAEIPSNLYQAVAEVLAYVYRLRHGRRRNE
jgi:flagellar biosynthetic protein FlhB